MAIERERQVLQVQSDIFASKKQKLNILDDGTRYNSDPMPAAFDNIDEDDEDMAASQPDNASATATMSIESSTIGLPSSLPTTVGHAIRLVEIRLRTVQAARYLQELQETIAEKSFQYSHTMRKAPRKGVRTRARTAIAKLNERITTLSRGYTKCRNALVALGTDKDTLLLYKELRKEDVKSSTAILDANIPGSTKVRLSWIWQTDAEKDPNSSPQAVRECGPSFLLWWTDFDSYPGLSDFRVHYLRGRAQKMRWEEEHTLLRYEMDWTTRWFTHQAQLWHEQAWAAEVQVEALAKRESHGDIDDSATAQRPTNSLGTATCVRGAAAYAHRKSWMYESMAQSARMKFLQVHPLFVSE